MQDLLISAIEILISSIPLGLVFAICGYFAKSIFQEKLNKDLEKFKDALAHKSKIEQIKFQSIYGEMHLKRVQVLGELYQIINELESLTINNFFSGEVNSAAFDKLKVLESCFRKNKIYIQDDIDAELESLINCSKILGAKTRDIIHITRIQMSPEDNLKFLNLNKESDELREILRSVSDSIVQKIRSTMSVESLNAT